ncbi:MAG: SDR family oxidoreductase [Vicinamibacterales bacterium]|nr:SDR family oxidoreductase [Vicinamibacterales bacterium]
MDGRAKRRVVVTGGAGYVGSALVPDLLRSGHRVEVIDLFWFGEEVFGEYNRHPNLGRHHVDIRDTDAVRSAMHGADAVIHLACISNDPSYELDPRLSKSINYDCFGGLVRAAAEAGAERFIYASSSSVYGVKDEPDVTEDAVPAPLTDYSKYKLACERDLWAMDCGTMRRVVVRPATVCGYANRLRLDLTVQILTIHALVNKRIRVFGGSQLRPNIHIRDMVRAYRHLLDESPERIDGQTFNVGFQNRSVAEIAALVASTIGDAAVTIVTEPTNDMRSYHVNSDKIDRVLGFRPRHSIEEAVADLQKAYADGCILDPLTNPAYSNIETVRRLVSA